MIDLNAQARVPAFHFNQQLLAALSDDTQRADLYDQLAAQQKVLVFQSGADARTPANSTEPPVFQQTVALLTAREHVELALSDDQHFSNAPYQALGSGTFMLGLDGVAHALQRGFAAKLLRYSPAELGVLIELAWRSAAVLPLQQRRFDAAQLAEQVGLRFAAFLFGYPLAEHPYIEAAMRKGYQQLTYQIIGRHFSLQPSLDFEAKLAGGPFLQHTTELLGRYAMGEVPDDVLEIKATLAGIGRARNLPELARFEPLCARMAREDSDLSGTERAVVVGGLIAGMIGNLQAAVCIALDALLLQAGKQDALVALAHAATPGQTARDDLTNQILATLAANPPAAFLPRQVTADITLQLGGQPVATLTRGTQVLLAMGAATRERLRQPSGATSGGDSLVYGGAPRIHQCIGDAIGTPLIVETVRQILMLPGLARALDARTGLPLRLKKTWGFRCDSLPLDHARDRVMRQQPLAIVMPIKTPTAVYAEKLKTVIGVGAPRIQLRLDQSRQVHFAWFLLLNNDTELALFTTFDGELDAYIKHFALEVGPLFDMLFECLADAPPTPVAEHADEFVDKVRQYNRTPVGNYFYSAYPTATVSSIQAALTRDAQAGQGAA
jgi:cytochrome P450